MILKEDILYKNHTAIDVKIIILTVFIAGLLNASPYFALLGVSPLYYLLTASLYTLIFLLLSYYTLNFLYTKKIRLYSFKYWGLLAFAILLKFVILFVQFPTLFIPGNIFFESLLLYIINFSLILIIVAGAKTIKDLKFIIISFGIGISFTAIIPLFFFPEMIGNRTGEVYGVTFTGSFWNSSVISYISAGWLLVAIATFENSRIKRAVYVGIFMLLVLASLGGLSRAVLLSMILSGLLYLLVNNTLLKYIKIIITTAFVLLLLSLFFQEPLDNFQNRLDGGINLQEESRTKILQDYIENFPDFFLVGETEGDYKKYSATRQGPHNVLLNWFAQFGILGFMGFLVLLFGIWVSIENVRKKMSKQTSAALYAWLMAYIAVALVNENGFNNMTVFLAIGIVLSWGDILNKNEKLNYTLY